MTHTTHPHSSYCDVTVGLLSDLRIDVNTVGMIAVATVGIAVHLLVDGVNKQLPPTEI
jgi:hypothetical protein